MISKSLGSTNKVNIAYAVIEGLRQQVPRKDWVAGFKTEPVKAAVKAEAKVSAKAEAKASAKAEAKTTKAEAKTPAKKTAKKEAK